MIAVKYRDGVIMCSDTLASYGSLARYKTLPRMCQIGSHTIIGASGEYSDFQEILRLLREKETEDWIQQDNISLTCSEYASYLKAVLYQRRNKMDPLYNSVLVAGITHGSTYVGYLDPHGTLLEADYHVTAFAHHLGKPILAAEHRVDMSEEDARVMIEKIMRTLFMRDARASNRIQMAKVTPAGVQFDEPYQLRSEWDFAGFREYMLNPLVG